MRFIKKIGGRFIMKKVDWKDIWKRSGKTFVQAFVAAVSIEQLGAVTDLESAKVFLRSMMVAGLSAGVSAVWNMVTSCLKGKEV